MPSKSVSLYITQIKFCRALAVVRSLPIDYEFQPSVADKLNFYGLYKQAIAGDCMQPKPSSIHIVDYAKWKSWEKLRGISPVEAQVQYISSLISLLQEVKKNTAFT
ncbi:acyl-CoA-binding protein [Mycotypha africana]|uniref:acyl-CoA-binding protein n=1 Tax=Mycotypha africana TaxID=64632 RepID=UPI002300BD0F|nr:acyl-CoA-binding protein [Mycotypha africana]KAI8967998.1 acyl-CoA-binding protein [Mycotypha africana]